MAGTTVYDFLPFLLYSHVDTHFESSCCEGAVRRLHTPFTLAKHMWRQKRSLFMIWEDEHKQLTSLSRLGIENSWQCKLFDLTFSPNAFCASHEIRQRPLTCSLLQAAVPPPAPACVPSQTISCHASIIAAHHLKSLLHSRADCPQAIVHLARRLSENETDDRLSRNARVLEAAQDVDLGVGQHNARARGILDSVFSLAVLAGDTTDGTGQVVAVEGLDVLDFESCPSHAVSIPIPRPQLGTTPAFGGRKGVGGGNILSIYRSSMRNKAMASSTSKPSAYARTKSAPFWMAPVSDVTLLVRSSTLLLFMFMRHCSLRCSTSGG